MSESTHIPSSANFRTYLGSSVFFLYIIVSVLFFSCIILMLIPVSYAARNKVSQLWSASISAALKICCGIEYEIEGLENIPPNQAMVVLSNHQSAWETVVLKHLLPTNTSIFKKSLLWIPFGGWCLATLKPIAIDRSSPTVALKKLLLQGKAVLDSGLWVIVFPEGTRTAIGVTNKFKAGGALLAVKASYPVLPIAHNAGRVWPRNSFLKYSGVIKLKIGTPIVTINKSAKEVNVEAETWIRKTLEKL